MGDYKVVDIEKLEAGLTATANAIRAKVDSTEQIEWKETGMADAIDKIFVGSNTSQDTVTPENLLEGITAHNAIGEQITGTIKKYRGEIR